MTDLSSLSKFRADADPEPERPPVLRQRGVWDGQIIAFDQTMGQTGWACVHSDLTYDLSLHKTGVLKTEPTGIKGYGDYMERVAVLRAAIRQVLRDAPTAMAHEEPPMGSGLRKPDSSLVAGAVVRCVAAELGIPIIMVHGQRAKKFLTGNSNADKKQVRAVLMETLPGMRDAKPMNDDVSDAVAIAVTAFQEAPTWL